ncbi:DNA-directed DNA polymerase alpha subunit pol12 [Puccinia graminis f. sp. tritici]|uniref:DNA-directed DNA polymerase alpha subunit pol12 n=1 Tax=Puccinia graminis f. sp. tritici TaxID=56615 RepID=A0A5B0P9Q5_PUCGR|nr:DNA-directed DNA polymerase alpha subunit pol12 [Puccinia graminis f. sp. tritici]
MSLIRTGTPHLRVSVVQQSIHSRRFTANDLDGFVDSITSKIRNALLGNSSTDPPQPQTKTHSSRSSDVFGKLESIQASNQSNLAPRPGPSGSKNQSAGDGLDDTVCDEESSDSHVENSIQPKLKTDTHIVIDSDDDNLASSPRGSQIVQNQTSQISQSDYSDGDQDSDDKDIHSESGDQSSDSPDDRHPASQDLSASSTSFLNDNHSHDSEDMVSIDGSIHGSISNSISASSDSLEISTGPKPPGEQPSVSKQPFSPGAGSSHERENNIHHEDDDFDDMEESEEEDEQDEDDEEDADDNDDEDLEVDGEDEGFDIDSAVADIDVNVDGEAVGPTRLAKRELEDGEIEEGELETEENRDHNSRDPREMLPAGDILVDAPFTLVQENTQDLDQNIHPDFRPESTDVDKQKDDHSSKILDQPSGTKPLFLPALENKKLSRVGSFSADGAMMFGRPVKVRWILTLIKETKTRKMSTRHKLPVMLMPQSFYRPEFHLSGSELVQDEHFLPINSSSEPQQGSDRATAENPLLPVETIEHQDANPNLDGSPQAVSPTFGPREVQTASNIPTIPRQEEQIEDDNDLFEGDEDLRLHKLGVDQSRLHSLNEDEDGTLPTVAPSGEVEDRFSTIERQFENFIARTVEPQLSAMEEQTQGTVCELLYNAITISQSAAVQIVVAATLETDSHVVDNAVDLTGAQDTHTTSAEITRQAIVVAQTEDTFISTVGRYSISRLARWVKMIQLGLHLISCGRELSPTNGGHPGDGRKRNERNHTSAQLYGSTDMKYSIIPLTLPQRSNFRQSINLDEDVEASCEAPNDGPTDMNLPSNNGPQAQLSPSHDQDDYDMLASSLIDGNSDVVPADPDQNTDKAVGKQDIEVPSEENLKLALADKAHENNPQDEKPQSGNQSVPQELGADTNPFDESSQLCTSALQRLHPPPVRPPKASDSTMDEADLLLSQFINCTP